MHQGSWVVCAALLIAAFGYASTQGLAARIHVQQVSAIQQIFACDSAQELAASRPSHKAGRSEAYYTFPQASPADELTAAVADEKTGRYSEAADHYRNFLKMEAANASPKALSEVRVRMATDEFMAHRYEDSLESLRWIFESKAGRAAVVIPAQAWVVAGLDNLQLNRLDAAIRNLRQALQADPASGTARLALGDALARSGHLRAAADEYRNQTQRTPKVVEAWYKLGVAEAQLAKETFSSFASRHPKDQVAKMLAAETCLGRSDGLGAAKILLPTVAAIPVPGASPVPGSSPVSGGRDGSATAIGRLALPLPGIHADLGQAFLEEGYVHAAASEFREELVTDAESAPAGFGLAETATLSSDWNSVRTHLRHLMLFHAQYFERRLESQPPAPLRAARKAGHLPPPATFASSAAGRLWQSWLQGNGMSGVRIESPRQDSCSSLPARAASMPGLWLTESCYARLIRQLHGRPDQKDNLTHAERAKLAEAYYRLSQYDDARAEATRLLQNDPESGWGAYWLIRSEQALSLQSLLQASSINPNSARVHEMLARNAADRYQWKQAIAEYELALRLAPNLAGLHFGLGTAYWQAGNWARAEAQLRQTLEFSPASTVAAYELGDTYVNEHQWASAVPYLKKAIQDSGLGRKARLDLAKAESELGQKRQALAELTPLEDDDANGEIHFRLAALYRKMGELDKARAALAASQKLRQNSDSLTVARMKAIEQERAKLEQAEKQESR